MMPVQTLSLTDRLTLILDGLCRAVAARVAGGALPVVMIVMVWRRVRRTRERLQGLLARFRAGRLWVSTGRPARTRGGARKAVAAKMPQRFGWLLSLVPQHAAGFASQLRVVLDDPEMIALLAACPQARRTLAPLCRMLAIEAAVLGPRSADGAPVRAAVVAAAEVPVVRKRVRKPRRKVDWGRIPLPRGVLAWARREGFGKVPAD